MAIDWLDYAHKLDKFREQMQDKLPAGVTSTIHLNAYGFGGAEFSVHLTHNESKLHGCGSGRTPQKAMEAAKTDLQKQHDERQRRPRVAAAEPRALT